MRMRRPEVLSMRPKIRLKPCHSMGCPPIAQTEGGHGELCRFKASEPVFAPDCPFRVPKHIHFPHGRVSLLDRICPAHASSLPGSFENQAFAPVLNVGMATAALLDMHKWSISALILLVVAALWLKIRAVGERIVPVGYQDRNGFHPGEKSTEDQWPPFW